MQSNQKIRSKTFSSYGSSELPELIKNGAVGVLPTDTLYGLVASALTPKAVAKVYRLKGRTTTKPNIILISGISQLDLFGISKSDQQRTQSYWPGPVSLVLACPGKSFKYLHRGTASLAFRWPKHPEFNRLLEATGPLIAPSANPEGQPPATTVAEAAQYFGEAVDFYIDGGQLLGVPSKLISLLEKQPKVLRK